MASFITKECFESAVIKEESTLQWKELPLNIIFKIDHIRQVSNGSAIVLTLIDRNDNICKVWALDRLCKALNKTKGCNSSLYLRAKGIKESKDTGRWYYDYDMIQID